jgi:hypothetical protein
MRKTSIAKVSMKKSLLAVSVAAFAMSAQAEDAATLYDAIADGSADLTLRYRYEFVDQDGPLDNANASTLKTRVTYKTQTFEGLSGLLEFDNNSDVLTGDFNSTQNGKTDYAVVADPKYTEINQAYVDYAAPASTLLRVGRQRINLDNQRFVGGVAWRQNEQTFDAYTVVNKALPDTAVTLSYITNVNDIFGNNINGEDHGILHVHNSSLELANVSAYGYLLNEISDTYGLRVNGKLAMDSAALIYALEYATQEQDKANGYTADYMLAEIGGQVAGITATLGYELLGADDDGKGAFQTPLATKHKFNGWADKFLATPKDGLEDIYVSVSGKVISPKVTIAYHQFKADEGGADYGNEIDFSIGQDFMEHYNVLLKYAHYSADTHATDTDKIWLQVGANF